MKNFSLFKKNVFIYFLPLFFFVNLNAFAEENKEKKKLYLSGHTYNASSGKKYSLSVKDPSGKNVNNRTLLKNERRFFIRLDNNAVGQTLTVKRCL